MRVSPPAWQEATIRDLLTAERLQSYLSASSGDLSRALSLYEWNTRAAGAVIQTVALAEVLVRNTLDHGLAVWAAQRPGNLSWFDLVPLDVRGMHDIHEARDRATRHGRVPEVHGKVVAELSFGFWRYLTTSRYLTSLWIPALASSFPHGDPNITTRRLLVEHKLSTIGFIRNRAAHHEPIHRRNLARDCSEII